MHLLSTFISERHAAKTFSTPPAFALSLRNVFRANQTQMSLNSLTPMLQPKGFISHAVIPFPYQTGGDGVSFVYMCVGGSPGLKPGFNGKWLLRHLLALWGRYRSKVVVGVAGSRAFSYCLIVISVKRSRFDSEQGKSKLLHNPLTRCQVLQHEVFCQLHSFLHRILTNYVKRQCHVCDIRLHPASCRCNIGKKNLASRETHGQC